MKLSEIKHGKYKPKRTGLLESDMKYTKEERGAFLESLRELETFKKEIFRESGVMNEKTGQPIPFSKRLKEISEKIGQIVQATEAFTLQETENNFDKIAVNRDLKELKTDYGIFEKTCNEMSGLQHRMESVYENMQYKMSKYY